MGGREGGREGGSMGLFCTASVEAGNWRVTVAAVDSLWVWCSRWGLRGGGHRCRWRGQKVEGRQGRMWETTQCLSHYSNGRQGGPEQGLSPIHFSFFLPSFFASAEEFQQGDGGRGFSVYVHSSWMCVTSACLSAE